MRINEPVTNRLRDYEAHQRIVSTTNAKGVITDVNKDFIDISGFTRDELIGQAHNMVRHPWMPQAAFAELWDHNKKQKPWMGMVKNRCKNGDHYWVDAFVTPIFENNQVVGFQSVRQKPCAGLIDRAERNYSGKYSLMEKARQLWCGISLAQKLFITFSLVSTIVLFTTLALPLPVSIAMLIATNLFASFFISKPWSEFSKECSTIFDSKMACGVYTDRTDELGQIRLALKFIQSQQDTILYRTAGVAEEVKSAATEAHRESNVTSTEIETLYKEVEMAATATHEMTATIQEVANNSASTSEAANESENSVNEGQRILNNTKVAMDELVDAVNNSASIIQNLSDDSSQIGSVVDVISGIAEQTNLLALNAAIEAARAGEQGRGFAVVADEVRALAAKTQESTGKISEMIASLQSSAGNAVSSIDQSHKKVNVSVENIHTMEEQFSTILQNVNNISGMCIQIATATEEQSSVAEEINANINNINVVGQNTIKTTQQVKESNEQLLKVSDGMTAMIEQFK